MASKTREAREASPGLQKRLAQIRACEKSGESLKAYAERHGLSPGVLYQAKKQARRRGLLPPHRGGVKEPPTQQKEPPAPRFVEAIRRPAASETTPAWRLRFASGETLEVHTPLGIEEALRLVAQLGARR